MVNIPLLLNPSHKNCPFAYFLGQTMTHIPPPPPPPHYTLYESSLSCLLQAIFEEGIHFLIMACNHLWESTCQILTNNVEDLQ